MNLSIHRTASEANEAAADRLADWLTRPGTRVAMVAAGKTPLDLYRRIAEKQLLLSHLLIFALDEYVGVPRAHPGTCGNLLRRAVAEGWGVPANQFFAVSPDEGEALASVIQHERRLAEAGGLDVLVLGLGQNGHIGFNEPGSSPESMGRIVDLEPVSVEANRRWFNGEHAPRRGVTVGLKTLLGAGRIMILAYGTHKSAAVRGMVHGPPRVECPASLLREHAELWVFLDHAAATGLAAGASGDFQAPSQTR
jgi:glucosamine-6-phosphate deaminase